MDVANTLAYFDTVTITTVKSFMVHALGEKTSLGVTIVAQSVEQWSLDPKL
jgi:hypothetical protein